MTTETPWRRSLHVAEVNNGSSTFVLNLASLTSQPIALDGSADDVWQLVDGRTTNEVLTALSSQYGVPSAEIDQPVREFLEQLQARGLISR